MHPGSAAVLTRRSAAALAALLLALLALAWTPASAWAHDSLVGSTPEDGQSLETVPEAVELTFTDTPAALGAEVIVEDSEGTDWSRGEVEIVDNTAVQPVSPDAPAGNYTVTWRVVSSDSHPIEGVFEFTATSGGAAGAEVSSPEPLDAESSAAGAGETGTEEAATTFPTSFLVIMIGVLIVLVVIIGLLARRRLGRGARSGPAGGGSAEGA